MYNLKVGTISNKDIDTVEIRKICIHDLNVSKCVCVFKILSQFVSKVREEVIGEGIVTFSPFS